MEWGQGTNTTNQIWTACGEGNIVDFKRRGGTSILTVETQGFTKKNANDNTLKITQLGEGMTGNSPFWGEVAMGSLKEVRGNEVVVEISTATKIDTRRNVPAWEEEGWDTGVAHEQQSQR